MTWTNNDDLTEPAETDDRPIMGVTGGQRAAVGDHYVLAFMGDGEEVDTSQGTRAAFDARVLEVSFSAVDGDGHRIEEGDGVRFMTGSSRFLSQLEEYAPVGGDTLRVDIEGTGYDAQYAVSPVDGDAVTAPDAE